MSAIQAADLHIIEPEHYAADGYPFASWDRLREEAPVFHHDSWDIPFWAITRQLSSWRRGS